MQKWMPIRGNFIENNDSIIFQGIPKESSNTNTVFTALAQQTASDGIILYENMISNGSIEATVEFEEFNEGDFAQIVFNYLGDFNYMCAGITNKSAKYEFNIVNGQLSTISHSGLIKNLPITKFDIKLRLLGSFLELFINDIKVLSSSIPFFVNFTQVGVWVKSNSKITVSNFKTDCKKPEAFIVSQFGGDYDVLYNEVILPACEYLHYEPNRGDEVASCSLIL